MSICQYSCKKEILDTCSRLVYLSSSRLTIDPRLKINNELKVGQRIMNNERWKMFISQIKRSWAQTWSVSSPQTVHPGSTRREERFLTVKDLLLPRRSFRWKKNFCTKSDEQKTKTDNGRQNPGKGMGDPLSAKQNNFRLPHRYFWNSINSRYNCTSNGCIIPRLKKIKDHKH